MKTSVPLNGIVVIERANNKLWPKLSWSEDWVCILISQVLAWIDSLFLPSSQNVLEAARATEIAVRPATDTFQSAVTRKFYKVCTGPRVWSIWSNVSGAKCSTMVWKWGHCTSASGSTFDIRHNKMTSVAAHFNRCGHSMEDLTIMINDQEDNVEIRKRERYWIYKLRTKASDGINRR